MRAPPALTPDTRLRWAKNLSIQCDEDGHVEVRGRRALRCEPAVLPSLALFAGGATVAEFARQAPGRLAHDFAHGMHTLLAWIEAGVLVAEDDDAIALPRLARRGFSGAAEHVALLDDRVRTDAFLRAIEAVVRPGDVVLDLGTGTGVLALAAARAGASQVHAVERGAMAAGAEALFRENGFADRIVLHRADSSHVELPRRADVLVTETVGNEPLAERTIEYVRDARRRLLVSSPRTVPAALTVLALPVSLPPACLQRYRFDADNTTRWGRWYGFDFGPLSGLGSGDSLEVELTAAELEDARWPARAMPLVQVDFAAALDPHIDAVVDLEIIEDAEIHGVCTAFELDLGGGQRLGHRPDAPVPGDSWRYRLWLFDRSRVRRAGETLSIRYRHTPLGTRLAVVEEASGGSAGPVA